MTNRLEKITQLKDLEERKQHFVAIKHDVSDYFCKETFVTATLNTSAYTDKRKYNGYAVEVDKSLFIAYITGEIVQLEEQIKRLINELTT